jgi:hypothetical protein
MGNPAQVLFAPRPRPVADGAAGQSARGEGVHSNGNGHAKNGDGGAGAIGFVEPPAPSAPAAPDVSAAVPAAAAPARDAVPEEAVPEAAVPAADVSPRVDLGRLALLGSANLDYLAMNFRESCREHGLALDLFVPEYGQVMPQLLDAGSALARSQPTSTDRTFARYSSPSSIGRCHR